MVGFPAGALLLEKELYVPVPEQHAEEGGSGSRMCRRLRRTAAGIMLLHACEPDKASQYGTPVTFRNEFPVAVYGCMIDDNRKSYMDEMCV